MADQENKLDGDNPTAVARETLRQLALRRIPPTPDNYRKLYRQIANTGDEPTAATVLKNIASDLRAHQPARSALATALDEAIRQENWPRCARLLNDILFRPEQAVVDIKSAEAGDENADLALLKEMLAVTLEYMVTGSLLSFS